jgi:hypothetical protein
MIEDIKAIRRNNLIELIELKFSGNKTAFARAINRPAPNIHRMLAAGKVDKRGIGETLARDIEVKLSLPRGWLDREPGQDQQSLPQEVIPSLKDYQRQAAEYADNLTPSQRVEWFRWAQERKQANLEVIEHAGLKDRGKKSG